MIKTELKKLKELDTFLRERNMKLSGRNIIVGFNANKYNGKDNYVQLNLNIGFIQGSSSDIEELNETPKIKNHYYIQKGKLKQY
jgi:hypothetical protein